MIYERGSIGEGTCTRCDRHDMTPRLCAPDNPGCPVLSARPDTTQETR